MCTLTIFVKFLCFEQFTIFSFLLDNLKPKKKNANKTRQQNKIEYKNPNFKFFAVQCVFSSGCS